MSVNGKSQNEIAKALGIMPFIVSKMQRQVKAFSLEKLKKIMRLCLEMDVAVKSGKMSDRVGLETIIATMGSSD